MKTNEESVSYSIRVDKWLWAARFYKTRQLAVKAIKTGKVILNRQNTKPASTISAGATLTIKRGPYQIEVDVLAISKTRGSASIAQNLYKETQQSIENREALQKSLAAQPKIERDKRKPEKRALRSSRELKRQG